MISNKLSEELKNYDNEIPKMEKALEKLRQEISDAKEEFAQACPDDLMIHKKNINELEEKKSHLLKKDSKKLNIKLEFLQEKLNGTNLAREEHAVQEAKADLARDKQLLENLIAKFDNPDKKSEKEIKEHQERLDELNHIKQELDHKLGKIINQIEELKSESNGASAQNHVLDSIFEAKEKGILSGVIGRLGDLGDIDKEYDIAISTCCPALNSIIVQTINDATDVMNYLKKNKIGTANILSLDQVTKKLSGRISQAFDAPMNSKRLFDLVRPSEKEFKVLFYQALFDTLVVNDIDTASNIAYGHKRYRVTTLNGEVIEMTGIASGGGKPKSGLIGSFKRKSSVSRKSNSYIEKLADEKNRISEKVAEISREIQVWENSLEQLKHVYENEQEQAFKEAYPKQRRNIENRIFNTEENIKKQEKLYEIAFKNRQDDEATLKKLQDLKDNTLDKQIEEINNQIDELQNELDEQMGEEYRQAKEKYENLERKYEKDSEIFNKVKSMKEVGEQELKNKIKQREENEIKIEEMRKQLEELTKQMKEYENLMNEELTKLEKLETELDEINQACAEETKSFNVIKKYIVECRQKEEETTSSMRTVDDKLKEYDDRVLRLNKQIFNKYRDLKQSLRELKQIKELGEIEKNLNNDDYFDQKENLKQEAETKGKQEESKEEPNDENQKADDDMDVDNNQDKEDDDEEIEFSSKRHNHGSSWQYFIDNDQLEIKDFKLRFQQWEELVDSIDEISTRLEEIEQKIEGLDVNMSIIDDFKRQISLFQNSNNVLRKFKKREKNIMETLEEIKKKKYDVFMAGFDIIKSKLKEMYRFITGDGDADLELKDSLDPFIEGVVFSVRPPKKSWKQISNLSGGEKTLASLSLIFALHHFKPTPIYCMDEIDAALDYKNVAIVASYVKKQAWDAQFIVISLRQNMFEMSDKMIGIYKIQDVTKTVSIAPRLFEKKIQSELSRIS